MTAPPQNLQAEWARLILFGLIRLGARDFVVSPGSRSTPLALALIHAEAALALPDLRIHSIIDERAASFFALGLARATGLPPVLICTSGTAPAHYYPAVIEAFESRLPLIVLSADRPPELQEVGAAQTIDQTELFGRFVARFSNLGAASSRPGSFEALSHKLELAFGTSRDESRPVHVNAPFYKPLEPPFSEGDRERALIDQVDHLLAALPRIHLPLPHKSSAPLLERALAESKRPLFVLGALRAEEFARVEELIEAEARARGCTRAELLVLGEVASGGKHTLDVEVTLRSFGGELDPDCVFQFGSRLCSTRYFEWLGRKRVRTVLVQSHDAFDPARLASLNLCVPSFDFDSDAWGGARDALEPNVRDENARFARAVESMLSERLFARGSATAGLEESRAMALISRALPPDTDLFVGNSLPLRLANAVMPLARQGRGALGRVFVQRGVNGIDGLIAGAAGLAAIPDPHPVALFLGDVSATHDLASLALTRLATRPLWIWVFDNDGGRIFEQLPLGRDPPGRYDLWQTPPNIDFVAVGAALGLASFEVTSEEELLQFLETFPRSLNAGGVLIRVKTRGKSGVEFFDSMRALGPKP